jgi:hypothetical protein
LKLRRQPIAIQLRLDPRFLRGLLDLLAMLVKSGEKEHVPSDQPTEARQGVRGDGRVRVSNVGHIVDVIDGGCDVEGFLHFNKDNRPRT